MEVGPREQAAVVFGRVARDLHVAVLRGLGERSEQRETEVRLEHTEPIGKREVAEAVGPKGARDLGEMFLLTVARADMLDHVIGDDNIERVVVERERRSFDALIGVRVTDDPHVDHVDGIDMTVGSGGIGETLRDNAGAGTDVEDAQAREIVPTAENRDDLLSLEAPAREIKVRVMTGCLGAHGIRDTNIAPMSGDATGSVLLVTSNFPRWAGDSVTPFVLHLAQNLQEIGWRVDVLAPHAAGAAVDERIEGVRVSRFRYLWPAAQETVCYGGGALVNLRQNRSNVAKLPPLVAAEWFATARRARKGYDVVNSHWILPQGFVAGFLPGHVPNVVTAHGGDVFGLQGGLLARAKRVALRRADAVTCNSSVTESAVHEIAPGVETRRIPMGVDVARVPDPTLVAELRARHRRNDGPLLVFVGRLVDEKGFADFLAAIAKLAPRLENVTGLVVGDGQDRGVAERLADELGIADRVHFAGWVDPAAVASHVAAADVFVAPSRRGPDGWVEAQGLSIIEAMALGVPVVASASGGIVDTIDDGESGLLVPERSPDAIAAAVERYLDDAALREQVRVRGPQVARDRFSHEASAAAFGGLFREVIERAKR